MRKIFEHLDLNKDGAISKEELRIGLLEIDNENFQELDVEVFMSCSDTNNDGFIDYNEFIQNLVGLLLQYDPQNTSWTNLALKWEKFTQVKLKEVFDHLDVDKNGTIDKAELGEALGQLGGKPVTSEELESIWSEADVNHDGTLDYTEFTGRVSAILVDFQRRLSTAREKWKDNDEEKFREVFKRMDKDNSGSISKEEFMEAMKEIDPTSYVEEDVEILFDCADIDESGQVDFEEFIQNLVGLVKQYKACKV
uniref:EF-hand domain-containing protein n=1 Tax=Arcella intermedia TaxID=1963864 RepID=A0A6B2LFD4_9EUKA